MSSSGEDLVVLRPTAVRVLAAITWTLMALYLGWTVLTLPEAGARFAPVAALVSAVVYAFFWRPGVAVDDGSVTLVNVLREVHIPFSTLRSVTTRYALKVETTEGSYTAWAAPAPGQTSSMSLSRRDASGVALLGSDLSKGVSASAAPNTDSGAAALLIRHRWRVYDERGGDQGASDGTVTVRWSTGVLVLLGVCAAATVLAFVL